MSVVFTKYSDFLCCSRTDCPFINGKNLDWNIKHCYSIPLLIFQTVLVIPQSDDFNFFLLYIYSGLSLHPVHNVMECEKIMAKGWTNRATGATLMNADSSRSHSIFSISLEMSKPDEEGEDHIRAGKLNLVDLAGSERQSKTGEIEYLCLNRKVRDVCCPKSQRRVLPDKSETCVV